MKTFQLPIDKVIDQLGYTSSSNLFKLNQINYSPVSSHFKRILNIINPYAMYVVNSNPFILFFDKEFNDNNSFKTISELLWNAQIPVAIFCSDNLVRIFNGLSIDLSEHKLKLIESSLINKCNENSAFSYWQISDPEFWNKYINNYSDVKLNQHLLDNILYLSDELSNTYKIRFSTKLILRLIFIRYLIDRGVDLDYKNFSTDKIISQNEFLRIVKNKEFIYKLFEHLKSKFNGNLFELGEEIKSPELTDEVFILLHDFFLGNKIMNNGQLSFFQLYDFNIIPVELISNIYEILLGKKKRDNDNAFYTPNYLVEYILDKTVTKALKENHSFKVLDPSCGSGIFLVDSYRRIIQEYLGDRLYCKDDKVLKDLLTENIYGIDINEEAIDVTIFSLYLTILDYKDPKTLSEFTLPNLKGKNLFVCDFFDEIALINLSSKKISFDFILGNPPWGNVKDGLHISYCKLNGYLDKQLNNEICRSFIFRANDFCSENTTCCFVIHSKLLYTKKSQAVNFRKFLLKNTEIKNIIELSSVRKLVFENANAPAAILSFRYCDNRNNLNNRFTYISVKPNIFFKLFKVICIEKTDVKSILQSLLYNNDWAWKTIVYGFSYDIDNIIKLKENFSTIQECMDNAVPPIIYGAGIQDNKGDAQDSTDLMGLPLLDSKKGVSHFLLNINKNNLFSKPAIHRTRNKELFEPPHCFTAKGLNCNNFKMRSAYSDEKLICKETMYVIKSNNDQKDILLNLVGLLNSSFYAYLNLMLGSSVGIEREQRFMREVLSFPYVYSKDLADLVEKIQIKNAISLNEETLSLIDEKVLSIFGMNNNKFIDYSLNISIPELTEKENSFCYKKVTIDDLIEYSKCFIEQFSKIYNSYDMYVSVKLYPNIKHRYTVFKLKISDNKPIEEINISNEIDEHTKLLTEFSVFSHNDKFYEINDIIHFNEDSFFIIKTSNYKNWHPAIAELDIAEVMSEILFSKGGDE